MIRRKIYKDKKQTINLMNKDKIYDLIFWTSMIVILVWIILKAVGIINTPVVIQLIPYAGGIFAFGVFFQVIKDLKDQMKEVKDDLKQINKRLIHVEVVVEKIT